MSVSVIALKRPKYDCSAMLAGRASSFTCQKFISLMTVMHILFAIRDVSPKG